MSVVPGNVPANVPADVPAGSPGPAITITYCTQCNWLLRAAWLAQELLQTFGAELGSVTLVPGTGGIFTIEVTAPVSASLWDRKVDGGFPGAAELKNRLRDAALPDWQLPKHVDRS